MSRIVVVILINHHQKAIDSINLLGSYRRRNMFPVRYGQTYRVYFYLWVLHPVAQLYRVEFSFK
jgi:hypothetical protein